MKYKVIGLDLSLTGTGVVVIQKEKIIVQKLIKSKPPEEKNPTTEIERIIGIKKGITDIIEDGSAPDLVVIEGLAYGVRNATALVQLSGLNYMIREYLYSRKIPFLIIAPTSVKKFITGSGIAKKDIMMLEVYKRYGVSMIDDNECDAYSLARIGLATLETNKDDLFEYQKEVVNLINKQNE